MSTSNDKLEIKYKKYIDDLFENFNLKYAQKNPNTNIQEMGNKLINKETFYDLVSAIASDYDKVEKLTRLLDDNISADSPKIEKWDEINSDFIAAFEKFCGFWGKCEGYPFNYAEELFEIIYNQYPKLCIEAFPVVLFIFTDSYFDFCKICRDDKGIIPEDYSPKTRASILSLFKKRICGDDFQYYLFSLIDAKRSHYSESSFNEGKRIYDSLWKEINRIFKKLTETLPAKFNYYSVDFSSKYKDLLSNDEYKRLIDDIQNEYNDSVEELSSRLKDQIENMNRGCINHDCTDTECNDYIGIDPQNHFYIKSSSLIIDFLNKCLKTLTRIINKYKSSLNNPSAELINLLEDIFTEQKRLLNDVCRCELDLLDAISSGKEDLSAITDDKYIDTLKTIIEQIERIISKKYNTSSKKSYKENGETYTEIIPPCKNFKAIWDFMHVFSPETESENYWANYDEYFSIFTLDYATKWIDCIILSTHKTTQTMFYFQCMLFDSPITLYNISSNLNRLFYTNLNDYKDFHQIHPSCMDDMEHYIYTLYSELMKDFENNPNAYTYNVKSPINFFKIDDQYENIWEFKAFPSIEDLKHILARACLKIKNCTKHSKRQIR